MKNAPAYSNEDRELVNKVLRCKDFYEILGVAKDTDDTGLKKAYRKLAQKSHPDKNKAPNADECFKKVSAAYDCLSNKEKRHRYDQGGGDDLFATENVQQAGQGFRGGGGTYYYSGNMDPNDIFFNFFSGGGFEDAFGMNGPQFRQRYQNQRRRQPERDENRPPANKLTSMILQFFPIIVILSYLLQNPIFMKSQYYSFRQTNKFPYKRATNNLRVQYFTDAEFFEKYKDEITTVEQEIEIEYVQILRENCREEEHNQQNLKMYYSMTWNSREKESQAHKIRNYKKLHCDKLNSLVNAS